MTKQAKEGSQEALRRIEKARVSRRETLDLNSLGLTVVPEPLSQLPFLRTLVLSGNQITTIPESITALSNLGKLDLNNNRITTIPDSICGLTKLTTLALQNNRITTIPESISRLAELRTLVLSGNQITTIPESITALSNLRALHLNGNWITTLPDSIGRLTKLTTLGLHRNRIAIIPESISRLSDLKSLVLSRNQITAVPESVTALKKLRVLVLDDNRITTIPESISRLAELRTLVLSRNQITAVPESVTALKKLRVLVLDDNRISTITESISKLKVLESLNLSNNLITEIPITISGLKNLKTLSLLGNPLPDELRAAVARGTEAFLRYVESVGAHAAHPRSLQSRLLGEPQAGKTTLLEALKGNPAPCDPGRKETLGVNVAVVDKKSPGDDQTLHLSVWDFAGQHMEHATHQPFLTENAIFIILWDARLGAGAGKRDLWYWLELLKMRVKEPKFLLVATHAERTPPDVNLTEIQRVYGGFQGSFAVGLCDLTGFDALETKILELAAGSPALKAVWPPDWLQVRDEIRKIGGSQPYVSSEEFRRLMKGQGVQGAQRQKDLAEQLHELGEILYFQELEGLSATVVLSPSWLSELIARVVHSRLARKNRGVLQRGDLDELWRDANLSSEVREHLVRLMDHFDLTYSTVDAADARIVVEALPYSTPEELELIKLPTDQAKMEMIFRFPTLDRHLPPGRSDER